MRQLAPLMLKPVFLTHRGEWQMHNKVLINDQPHRFGGLGDQPDIHFWDIPLECIPKVQVRGPIPDLPPPGVPQGLRSPPRCRALCRPPLGASVRP